MKHNHKHDHNHASYMEEHCEHSIVEELICHMPYSILSVAFALIVVSLLYFVSGSNESSLSLHSTYYMLFHNFHFLHIIFAITSSIAMFSKYSNNIIWGTVVSVVSASFFCIASDVFFPYIGGTLLGASMKTHVCFLSDFTNISIFIIIGVVNGVAQSWFKKPNVIIMHGLHIIISSFASTFYLVANGFNLNSSHLGLVFLMLLIAVVLPCTLSDILVPMFVAGVGKKNEKH
ncbi:hypothetical protein HN446_04320 [bacterium]|jgi:hypothetical protein|nr:hypothetical protein [bacterium]